MKNICLTMIVKNERAIIERCLESALPFVDTWSICDTGSTDGTGEVIEQFFADKKIPGKLTRTTFKDFAQARNESLDVAASIEGWEYALLIDADMVLEGQIDKSKLTAPSYKILQRNGSLDYWNVRLVKRASGARYVGVTHEFLAAANPEELQGLTVDDRDDGGSKSDKSERDIRLLSEGLAAEPNNVRYMYYLANTYREAGRHAEAVQWYLQRIAGGGWDEEVWSAYYGMAKSYLAIGDEASFVKTCMDAYNFRPTRGEPLKLLARFYRERSKNDAALLVAEALAKVEYPNDSLFVERDVYDYGAAEELSIAGFYSKIPARKQAGYKACSDLTLHWNDSVRDQARKNFTFFAKSAAELFGAETRPIDFKPDNGYAPMNPSVCIGGGGRLVLVRTVNYIVTDRGEYPTVDGSSSIQTKNYVLEMDEQWQPVRSTLIEDASGLPKNNFPVEGFEDCRIWEHDGKFFASATVRNLGDGRCEIGVLTLDDKWRVTDIDIIRDYEHGRHQKNWMPVAGQPGRFVYGCHPTIVIERSGNKTVEVSRHEPGVCLGEQRGGSQLVHRWCDGWLCLTHEVVWRPERIYLHRFVAFDRDMRIEAVSDPFYFQHLGIEFCAGMARDGDKLVASFGVNDSSAHLAFFDPARVEAVLV
jgi:glycosyltransferase involved in cell wall biosynthesis